MAARKEKITLTLDFNVERGKIKEIGELLNKDLEKGLRGTKTQDYFQDLKTSVVDFNKSIGEVYTTLQKPLVSKTQVKELATNLESAFKGLDNKLLSLQGNIGRTFNSTSNVAALKQIRQLGDELDKLTADYQAASQLFSKSRSLGNKGELKSQLSAASKEYDILSKKQTALTAQEKKQQAELKTTIDSINAALEEKAKIAERINQLQSANGVSSQAEFNTLIATKVDEQKDLINSSVSIQDADTLKSTLKDIRDILKEIYSTSNATAPKLQENFENIERENREAEEQARTFKSIMKELGIPMLTLQELASSFKQVISYSYDYVKNLDAALTEIAVVSDKTRDEVMALTDTFIELSAKTGMAIDDIAQASTIFYQQGLNDEAVAKMTEWTALFAKISGEDVPTAADQLTAAINGFGFAANDVSSVVDKLSVLAAYSAADIDELATAMSKGASQAAMAGLTFDQYNAYLATMIETTREAPENLGTSLKTIMSRFLSIKSGDNTEDDTDINDVETALKSVGVQLRDSEGQLRELGDVLDELGPKWDGLDRNTQAYLGTVIAGTRQQSRFISLMQNWDRALELTTASENSAGAASKMHAAAMEGLEASLNNLTNAWQNLISSLLNGDDFKWLIDILTSIVKWFGDGHTALKLFTTAMLILDAKTILTNISLAGQADKYKNINNVLGILGKKIKKIGTDFSSLGSETSELTKKIQTEKAYVDELVQSYERLRDAKQQANGAYDSTTGTTSGGIGNTNIPKVDDVIPDAETVKETAEEVKKSDGLFKKFKEKIGQTGKTAKTAAGNINNLLGGIQTGITVGLVLASAITWVEDILTTTSEEMKEKAQEAYDATQEEIDKRTELIESVEANADIYDKLSKKVNKSTDEVNQLADAADALAKAAPSALIGYDSEGNAIIDTNSARAKSEEAEKELADYAKEQMGNIGDLARADIREQAEQNVANSSSYDTAKSIELWGGVALTAAGIAAAHFWNPAGWVAAAVAGISAAAYAVTSALEQDAISDEELAIAQEKAADIWDNYSEDLLTNMSRITSNSIKDKTVDGVSREDRSTVANYIGKQWIQNQVQDLTNQLANEDIDEKEYEEKFKALGDDWEQVLKRIDDSILASAYTAIEELSDNIGEKSYESVEEAIEEIITSDMGITKDDPLFETLKAAFFTAAYNGTSLGVYTLLNDLKTRREQAKIDFGEDSEQVQAYDTAINSAKKMSSEEVGFYDDIAMFDNVGLFNAVISQYGTTIREGLDKSTEAACLHSIGILDSFKTQAEAKLQELADQVGVNSIDEVDYDSLTVEQRKYYDKWTGIAEDAASSIEEAWNQLDISIDIPWETLWDDFEKLTDRAKTARETVASLASGEGIDASGWKEFTTMFDDIDFSAFDTNQLAEYSNALDTIAGSLEVVNGQIYANGEAVESIADLEEMAIQASIEATRQELTNKKLELEGSKAIIDAQAATLEWKIAEAEGSGEAEQYKIDAQEAWGVASDKINTVWLKNQASVTEAMVKQYANAFAAIGTKYNQLITAAANGKIDEAQLKDIQGTWTQLTESLTFDSYSAELENESIDSLKNQLAIVKKASGEYETQISNIKLKLATLGSGLWSSENGVASGKDTDNLEQYEGELKKIYNILNRIEMLEHRHSMLETYFDSGPAEEAGSYLQQMLDYSEELVDQYSFLTSEQKKFTNGWKEAIENSDVSQAFSFDEFGQIIINWEEYNKLTDVAEKNTKSLKEQADELYTSYTEALESTMDYMDKLLDVQKQVISENEKIIDSYTSMEDEIVDAIKEIYQKILDTKLDAIDQEKEALEDLQEAREQARKDQENAKTISGLQTNIQRAMMDSSGASDISFIKAQQDMNDKLEEIADDKYSEELDNIINRLDEEKDALQDQFDELFDNLDWLFEELEANVMGDADRIFDILTQTDEWGTLSPTKRKERQEEWQRNMSTYMEALQGGRQIADVYNELVNAKAELTTLESVLKTDVVSAIGNAATKIGNSVSGAVSSAYSSGYNAGASSVPSGTSYKINGGEDESPNGDVNKITDTTSEAKDEKMMSKGDKIEFRPTSGRKASVTVYDEDGKSVGTYSNNWWWDKNGTAGEIKKINGERMVYFSPAKGYVPTRHFQTTGSKGVSTRYYLQGGFADYTGPAWLDGTPEKPEAVLNALQTEHFIKFTDTLDKLFAGGNVANTTSSVSIDTISFNVESMSSAEDGEEAFNMFVSKFKEIGSQSGIKIDSFKNRL